MKKRNIEDTLVNRIEQKYPETYSMKLVRKMKHHQSWFKVGKRI